MRHATSKRLFIAASMLSTFAALAETPAPYTPSATTAPGWSLSGKSPAKYTPTFNAEASHTGKRGAMLAAKASGPEDFASLMQVVRAEPYRGKRVRLSSWLKTQSAGEAHMWLRIDGATSTLAMDNMDDRPVKGTVGWTRCVVVMDVPDAAADLAFGVFLVGTGTLSADDFELSVVAADEPTTKAYGEAELNGDRPYRLPTRIAESAINLGFED